MGKTLKLAWRNMWRNWRRTVIAVIAIMLGVTLLIFFDGLIKGSDKAIFGNAVRLFGGNIQVHAPGYKLKASRLPLYPIADADLVVQTAMAQPEIQAAGFQLGAVQPKVIAAAKRINTGGFISSREGAFAVVITGVEPEVEAQISVQAENIIEGRWLVPGEGDAVVIGKRLAELLGVGVGDRVTLVGHAKHETTRQRTMTVVGIYGLGMADAEKGTVFITLDEAQSLYNMRGEVTEIVIALDTVGQEELVIDALKKTLPGYEIDSWNTLHPEIQETLQTKLAFTTVFGLILVFIASIGILNIQLMAVFERTREMGVLAALGMKGRQIMSLFVTEGALIGVVGGVMGCLLGLVANWAVSAMGGIDLSYAQGMGDMMVLLGERLLPYVTAADVVNRGLIAVFMAALASLYPAWQAARKEPAEALHHV